MEADQVHRRYQHRLSGIQTRDSPQGTSLPIILSSTGRIDRGAPFSLS
jgi:hypothetical protein